ncbi:MAG TPA: alpha/beta hydrolase [Gammaproteobacteria bacterium]|nr:alpha/beta hydrolase [Gammaproteobacteria bacterium]
MRPEVRERIRALGRELTPELIEGTHRLFAELHARAGNGEDGGGTAGSRVTRDLRYGPDERNRLDLWLPAAAERGARANGGGERTAGGGRPALLFVHGGGFVRGDKCIPGLPFYDNIGRWAAARGFIGATMTYRLAPKHAWPAGAEDVGRAVEWLAEHVAAHGGDPGKIFAMGQSAGAVHVATYLAFPRFQGSAGARLAGALLTSGLYDLDRADRNEFQKAYFGSDESRYAERSSLTGLVRTNVPILASVSEFDADDFYRQAALFVSEFANTRKRYPRMLYLTGHNHLSSVHQIGLPEDSLGPEVAAFIEAVSTASAE